MQAAVLAWAVRGCLEWQRGGLRIPDLVRGYTEEYRNENDPLRDWVADRCELDPKLSTSAKALRESYVDWCEDNGIKPLDAKKTAEILRKEPYLCRDGRTGQERRWDGIGFQIGA